MYWKKYSHLTTHTSKTHRVFEPWIRKVKFAQTKWRCRVFWSWQTFFLPSFHDEINQKKTLYSFVSILSNTGVIKISIKPNRKWYLNCESPIPIAKWVIFPVVANVFFIVVVLPESLNLLWYIREVLFSSVFFASKPNSI